MALATSPQFGRFELSNHFHLVAAGDRPDAISRFMMNVNGQYSAYRHAAQNFAVISGRVVSSPASSTTTIGPPPSVTSK